MECAAIRPICAENRTGAPNARLYGPKQLRAAANERPIRTDFLKGASPTLSTHRSLIFAGDSEVQAFVDVRVSPRHFRAASANREPLGPKRQSPRQYYRLCINV
jgi:hypothetical protein